MSRHGALTAIAIMCVVTGHLTIADPNVNSRSNEDVWIPPVEELQENRRAQCGGLSNRQYKCKKTNGCVFHAGHSPPSNGNGETCTDWWCLGICTPTNPPSPIGPPTDAPTDAPTSTPQCGGLSNQEYKCQQTNGCVFHVGHSSPSNGNGETCTKDWCLGVCTSTYPTSPTDAPTAIGAPTDAPTIGAPTDAPTDPPMCAVTPPAPTGPQPSDTNLPHNFITCPVMRALVAMGDLVPAADGTVTKQQTFDSMLKVGISEKIALETTNANFKTTPTADTEGCLKCPEKVNVFEMKTIPGGCMSNADTAWPIGCLTDSAVACTGCTSPDDKPQQHFRSTGICDNGCQFGGGAYDFGASRCLDSSKIWGSVETKCFSAVWDREIGPIPSAQIDHAKRPSVDLDGNGIFDECVPTDTQPAADTQQPTLVESALNAAQDKCPSQLHGAIHFIHQAFGTPRESEGSEISEAENRALWLGGQYTKGFMDRSPRDCIQSPTCPENGCQQCLADVVPGERNAGAIALGSTDAERYCLCILANVRDESDRQSITDFVNICTLPSRRNALPSRKLVLSEASGSFIAGSRLVPVSFRTPDPMENQTTTRCSTEVIEEQTKRAAEAEFHAASNIAETCAAQRQQLPTPTPTPTPSPSPRRGN